MRILLWMVVGFSCAGHGRRLQRVAEQFHGNSHEEHQAEKALAGLFGMLTPSSGNHAYAPGGANGIRKAARHALSSSSTTVACNQRQRATAAQATAVEVDAESVKASSDLAALQHAMYIFSAQLEQDLEKTYVLDEHAAKRRLVEEAVKPPQDYLNQITKLAEEAPDMPAEELKIQWDKVHKSKTKLGTKIEQPEHTAQRQRQKEFALRVAEYMGIPEEVLDALEEIVEDEPTEESMFAMYSIMKPYVVAEKAAGKGQIEDEEGRELRKELMEMVQSGREDLVEELVSDEVKELYGDDFKPTTIRFRDITPYDSMPMETPQIPSSSPGGTDGVTIRKPR